MRYVHGHIRKLSRRGLPALFACLFALAFTTSVRVRTQSSTQDVNNRFNGVESRSPGTDFLEADFKPRSKPSVIHNDSAIVNIDPIGESIKATQSTSDTQQAHSPTFFRLGGIPPDSRFDFTGTPCPHPEQEDLMHVVFAFEIPSESSETSQIDRLRQSIRSIAGPGCGTSFNCRARLVFHVFYSSIDTSKLEKALGSLVFHGANILFHPTNFEAFASSNRKVWGHPGARKQQHELRDKLSLGANYFRYYCAEYLKQQFGAPSFLYLDTDTIALRDGIERLFQSPLPLVSFGVQKQSSCTASKILLLEDPRLQGFKIKNDDPCLAASVMLVNTSLWLARNITAELDRLLALNAKKKLWHLGSMPPLMVALHGLWTQLTGEVYDGKGLTCETLRQTPSDAILIHPFKPLCSDAMGTTICLHGKGKKHTKLVGSARISKMQTRALAEMINGTFISNPSDDIACDLIVNMESSTDLKQHVSALATNEMHPRYVTFKPDNRLENNSIPRVHFVLTDNDYMDQAWQLRIGNGSVKSIRLELVENMGHSASLRHFPRRLDHEVPLICYHGNGMHVFSLIPKLLGIKDSIHLRLIVPAENVEDVINATTVAFGPDTNVVSHVLAYEHNMLYQQLQNCDIGLAPTEVHAVGATTHLARDTLRFFVRKDVQRLDKLIRCKQTANAGRMWMFFQLGVPTITDTCAESVKNAYFGGKELAYIAHSADVWNSAITRLLSDFELRVTLSQRSREFAEEYLTVQRQAARFLDRLSCHGG